MYALQSRAYCNDLSGHPSKTSNKSIVKKKCCSFIQTGGFAGKSQQGIYSLIHHIAFPALCNTEARTATLGNVACILSFVSLSDFWSALRVLFPRESNPTKFQQLDQRLCPMKWSPAMFCEGCSTKESEQMYARLSAASLEVGASLILCSLSHALLSS